MTLAVVIIVAMIIGLFGGLMVWNKFGGTALSVLGTPTGQVVTPGQPQQPTTTISTVSPCSSTLYTRLYLQMRNTVDKTQADWNDMNAYVFDSVTGAFIGNVSTGTTGTYPNYLQVDCGREYLIKGISADGNTADNGRFTGVTSTGQGNTASLTSEGFIKVYVTGAEAKITAEGSRHGVLQFKLYDLVQRAYMYDDSDATANSWELTGANFTSTTDNATATAIGSTDELRVNYELSANQSNTNFNDFGTYILMKASASVWDNPTVKWGGENGQVLVESTAELTPYEKRAYSLYDYIYKVDDALAGDIKYAYMRIKPLSGINPTSQSLTIAFASRGSYTSIQGALVNIGSVKDDASTTAVFTLQTTYITVS